MEKCRNLLRRSLLGIASLDPCLRQGQDGFASESAGRIFTDCRAIYQISTGFLPVFRR